LTLIRSLLTQVNEPVSEEEFQEAMRASQEQETQLRAANTVQVCVCVCVCVCVVLNPNP